MATLVIFSVNMQKNNIMCISIHFKSSKLIENYNRKILIILKKFLVEPMRYFLKYLFICIKYYFSIILYVICNIISIIGID